MDIRDCVAFVTGANRGLGRAFAQALLDSGARKVYAAARDPSAIDLPGAVAVRLDVTRADDIAAAARDCGDVDLLVNNAGIFQSTGMLTEGALTSARAQMEVNYFGPLSMGHAFAPVLARNGGGAIVNVLSVLSWIAPPGTGGYSASKAAAWALTNGLRNELPGTQVVGLHVGYMDTDMVRDVDAPKSQPADVVRQVLDALREGRSEVLADGASRQVKAGLSADPAVYLVAAG